MKKVVILCCSFVLFQSFACAEHTESNQNLQNLFCDISTTDKFIPINQSIYFEIESQEEGVDATLTFQFSYKQTEELQEKEFENTQIESKKLRIRITKAKIVKILQKISVVCQQLAPLVPGEPQAVLTIAATVSAVAANAVKSEVDYVSKDDMSASTVAIVNTFISKLQHIQINKDVCTRFVMLEVLSLIEDECIRTQLIQKILQTPIIGSQLLTELMDIVSIYTVEAIAFMTDKFYEKIAALFWKEGIELQNEDYVRYQEDESDLFSLILVLGIIKSVGEDIDKEDKSGLFDFISVVSSLYNLFNASDEIEVSDNFTNDLISFIETLYQSYVNQGEEGIASIQGIMPFIAELQKSNSNEDRCKLVKDVLTHPSSGKLIVYELMQAQNEYFQREAYVFLENIFQGLQGHISSGNNTLV